MKKFLLSLVTLFISLLAHSAEVTYLIDSYNADAQDFIIKAFGQQPVGSDVWVENDFGATRGNRYNQIPRNRQASLFLSGWNGCIIKNVTLSMCSNNKAGSFSFTATSADSELCNYPARDFADSQWYGRWVSKDLVVYVDIKKEMQNLVPLAELTELCIKGGNSEGSVYLNAVTIEYEPGEGVQTESPMGYVYEKLEKKSTLSEGDVLMLYRSGNAAGDIDGIEKSGYLDIIGITSTNNVYETSVSKFTLGKDDTGSHWTLTDQYGRKLGAASQKLKWDEGECGWDITLGYDGATIASANEKNGTIRYNIPESSYGRFALYTSKSLTLPYLYRRVRQNEPVLSTAIKLSESEKSVDIAAQDTAVVYAKLLPATATDFRISWQSDNDEVATVSDGIVILHKAGDARITATSRDSGVQATMLLHVTDSGTASISTSSLAVPSKANNYNLNGTLTNGKGIVVTKGKKFLVKAKSYQIISHCSRLAATANFTSKTAQ